MSKAVDSSTTDNGNLFEPESFQDVISVLNLHAEEWRHRDTGFYNLLFKYFISTLIVILFPNGAGDESGIVLDFLHVNVFRVTGLFMSLIFLYKTLGMAVRLQTVGDTYAKIMGNLPAGYRRISVRDSSFRMNMSLKPTPNIKKAKNQKLKIIFTLRYSYFLCIILFLGLFTLSLSLMQWSAFIIK